eukprot:g1181.t1
MQSMQLFRRLLPVNISSRHRRLAFAPNAANVRYQSLVERFQLALDSIPDDRNCKRMFLVDILEPINRMHAVVKDRYSTSTDITASIISGVLKHIFALLLTRPVPEYFVVAFDAPGEDFRRQIYSAYKGQRDPPAIEIMESIPLIQEALMLLGIKWVMVHSIEADDSIAILAKRFAGLGIHAHIVSKDKDFFQLLEERVSLVRGPMGDDRKFTKYTPKLFKEEFGIEPINFIDILALEGDHADNIPGVKQIGPRSALSLVQQYGNIESIFDNASEVECKRTRNVLIKPGSKATALLSRDLVTLVTELNLPPLQFPTEDARIEASKENEVKFQQFLKQLNITELDRDVQAFFKLHTNKSR